MSDLQPIIDNDTELKELWHNLSFCYTESQGMPLLRKEIAKLYSDPLSSDDVLCVVPEEGILLTMLTILEPGDNCIVTFPGYQSLYQIAESLLTNVTVSKWHILYDVDHKHWHVDIECLRSQLVAHPNTKLIVINFPHNPTGLCLDKFELEAVVALAKEFGCYVFSDEMYIHLTHESGMAIPSASELYENAISLNGMSKSFSLPGLRVGWLITRNKTFLRIAQKWKDYTTICGSAPSEILSIAALRNRSEILSRNVALIQTNLDLLDNFFARYHRYFSWNRPKAGSTAFVLFNHLNLSVSDLAERLVEKSGVLILPDEMYGDIGSAGSGFWRLGFGRRNLPEVLKVMEEFLEQHLDH
eukprot:TRINITY_DN5847_c0_g1_i1.p1 TRINITY_DN5847_c0_g1~~TRINITY_DN5847_c0_g1_i1.p1  ORF type:complete len:357 (-),score=31.99 TRINITY_DN5847_c0_g1_i1:431-1501(-)